MKRLSIDLKGGEIMRQYSKPTIVIFDEEAIWAIENLARCSGCGGKCHRGPN